MKKGNIIAYIILILLFLSFLVPFCVNEIFIYKYNKEDYNRNFGESLLVIGWTEKYISHYNYGNLLYQIGYYEDAITQYEEALKNNPIEERVCPIRINLALAMVATVNEEMECEEQLETLALAREVLYEGKCAYENNDYGSSEEAKELEIEILALEEETKKMCEDGMSGEDDSDSDSQNDDEKRSEEEKKSEELEERNEGASGSRQEELDKMEGYDNYSYYDGKKW